MELSAESREDVVDTILGELKISDRSVVSVDSVNPHNYGALSWFTVETFRDAFQAGRFLELWRDWTREGGILTERSKDGTTG